MAIENISVDIKGNMESVISQLKSVDAQLKKLSNSRNSIELRADKLETAKTRIASVNLQLKELTAKKADIKVNTKDADEAKKKIELVNERITKLRSIKANLQVTTERLKGADKDLKNLNKQMEALNKQKAKLQIDASEANKSQTTLQRLSGRLRSLSSQSTSIDISANIGKLGADIDNIGDKMLGLVKTATIAGVGIASALGVMTVKTGLQSAQEFEQMTTRFEVLTGSADEARKAMTGIENMAIKTPFDVPELAEGVANLTLFTEDYEKATKMMEGFGGAVLASGGGAEELKRFSQNLSIMMSPDFSEADWKQAMAAASSLRKPLRELGITSAETLKAYSEANNMLAGEVLGNVAMDLTNKTQIFDKTANNLSQLKASFEEITAKFAREIVINSGIFDLAKTVIKDTVGFLDSNKEAITGFATNVGQQLTTFYAKLKEFDLKSFGAGIVESFNTFKEVVKFLSPSIDLAEQAIKKLGGGNFAKGLGKLPMLFLATAVGAKVLGKSLKLLSNFKIPFLGKKGGGVGGGLEALTSGLTGFVKNAASLALIFGAMKVIQEGAQTLEDINNKVPANLDKLAPKLINMGIALTSMGALVAIAGVVVEADPVAAIAGLSSVWAVTELLVKTADALKEVNDKVPENIGLVAKKMANIAIAIGGMSLITGALGLAMSSGLGLIIGSAGLVTVYLVAEELIHVSKAIRKLDKSVPVNSSGIIKKIENISDVIKAFNRINVGNLFSILKNTFKRISISVISDNFAKISKLSKEIEKLSTDKIRYKKVSENIESIKKISKVLTNAGNFSVNLNTSSMNSSIEELKVFNTFVEELKKSLDIQFASAEVDKFKVNIEGIRQAIDALLSADFIPKSGTMTTNVNAPGMENVTIVEDIEKNLPDFERMKGIISKATKRLEELNALSQELATALSFNFDASALTKFQETLRVLSEAINQVMTIDFMKGDTVTEFINAPGETGTRVRELEKEFSDLDEFINILDLAGDRVEKINSLSTKLTETLSFNFDASALDNFKNTITNIKEAVRSIMASDFSSKTVTTTVVNAPGMENVSLVSEEGNKSVGDIAKQVSDAIEKLSKLKSVAEKINEVAAITINEEAINILIEKVTRIMTKLSEFSKTKLTFDELTFASVITEFKNIVVQLTALSGSFEMVGGTLGQSVIQGFLNKKIPSAYLENIIEALNKLKTKTNDFLRIGESYGNKLKDGFKKSINGMIRAVESEIINLNNYSSRFGALGTNFGMSLSQQFGFAISGMSNDLSREVNAIQRDLNSLKVPNLNTGSTRATAINRANGGIVPNYLADGGVVGVFKKKGTDTVPAMLTPGEFVQKKQAVNTFGLDFMNKVNNLDVKGAFKSLNNRFNASQMITTPISTTINNINTTSNNNAKVIQNINSDTKNYNSFKSLNRFARGL